MLPLTFYLHDIKPYELTNVYMKKKTLLRPKLPITQILECLNSEKKVPTMCFFES